MLALTIFYLTMSAVAVLVAAFSRDRHALQIALVLALSCAMSNATWISHNWWTWPAMDAAIAWFVTLRCRLRFADWKLVIVLCLCGQAIAHMRWQLGDKFDNSAYAYHLTLNVLFLAQLGAVASPGSENFGRRVRNLVRDRLSSRRVWRPAFLRRQSVRQTDGRER